MNIFVELADNETSGCSGVVWFNSRKTDALISAGFQQAISRAVASARSVSPLDCNRSGQCRAPHSSNPTPEMHGTARPFPDAPQPLQREWNRRSV